MVLEQQATLYTILNYCCGTSYQILVQVTFDRSPVHIRSDAVIPAFGGIALNDSSVSGRFSACCVMAKPTRVMQQTRPERGYAPHAKFFY